MMLFLALGLLAGLVSLIICFFQKGYPEVIVYNREIRRKRLKVTKEEYRNYQKAVDRHNVLLKQIEETQRKIKELKKIHGQETNEKPTIKRGRIINEDGQEIN
jgi:hypothetical protein